MPTMTKPGAVGDAAEAVTSNAIGSRQVTDSGAPLPPDQLMATAAWF